MHVYTASSSLAHTPLLEASLRVRSLDWRRGRSGTDWQMIRPYCGTDGGRRPDTRGYVWVTDMEDVIYCLLDVECFCWLSSLHSETKIYQTVITASNPEIQLKWLQQWTSCGIINTLIILKRSGRNKKRQGINEERRKSLPVIQAKWAQTIKLEDHRDPTLLYLFAIFTQPTKLKEEYLHRLGKTRIYTSNKESSWLKQCTNNCYRMKYRCYNENK